MRTFAVSSLFGVVGVSYYLTRKLPVPTAEGPEYQVLPKIPYDQHPNKHFLSKQPHTIGIIGGGPSGLITAKTLSQQGYQVEVLEKKSHFGGVWFDVYEGAGLYNPYPHYNMPDHEFPPDSPMLPKQDQVLLFFDKYVERFNLRRYITHNAEVKSMRQNEDGTWVVQLSSGVKKQYDFLVLCNGLYHKPYIPQLPGLNKFKGKVLHSSVFKNAKEVCAGKKVVVVGGQKSAYDAMNLAFESGSSSVTGLMQDRQWTLPESSVLGFSPRTLHGNRFASVLLPPSYTETSLIERLAWPFIKLFWWVVARETSKDLPEHLKPNVDLRLQIPIQLMTRDEELFKKLKRGDIPIVTGSIDKVTPDGVVSGDRLLPADVLIFATGYEKDFIGLKEDEDGVWLYRSILVPGLTNFATIGFAQSVVTLLACNMQATWLAEVLRGKVQLPSHEVMLKDVETRKRYQKKVYANAESNYAWIDQHLIGLLLADMKIQERRADTLLKHWFFPLNPTDYKLVVTHRV